MIAILKCMRAVHDLYLLYYICDVGRCSSAYATEGSRSSIERVRPGPEEARRKPGKKVEAESEKV
jgi:hypothetical protein